MIRDLWMLAALAITIIAVGVIFGVVSVLGNQKVTYTVTTVDANGSLVTQNVTTDLVPSSFKSGLLTINNFIPILILIFIFGVIIAVLLRAFGFFGALGGVRGM